MSDDHQAQKPFAGVGVGAVNRLSRHTPPSTLYHYTSGAGLEGILDTHSFWMTDIRYMNDASEGVYGLNLLAALVREFLADKGDHAQALGERVLDQLGRFAASQPLTACCFCRHPDLLTQWRAYGGGQVAYSIEVNTVGLLDPANFQPLLLEVIYDEREQRELLLDAIKQIYEIAMGVAEDPAETELEAMVSDAATELHFVLYFLKHPAFSSEQEFRLTLPRSAIKHYGAKEFVRNTPLGFAPYFKWKPNTGRLPITGIKVGPTLHRGHAFEGLSALVDTTSYKGVALLPPSLIPLR